jgi:hypothetical protein
MTEIRKILVDGNHPLLKKEGMLYKEFPSDYKQIRYFTVLIVQKASPEIRDVNLLEQQISELIKNAIKHGNKLDPGKLVRVWFYFSLEQARLIEQYAGEGFQKNDEWNAFNTQRIRCFNERDFEGMAQYVSIERRAVMITMEEISLCRLKSTGTGVCVR